MTDLVTRLTDPVPFWMKSWRDHLARNPSVSGETSLALLKEHARTKLTQVDRERLAQGLHAETARLVGGTSRRVFSNAEWMRAAGLDDEPANASKRITEYILPPHWQIYSRKDDSDSWELRAKRISASARNFALLIDALREFTDEDHGQLCRRIFAGTSFATTVAETDRHTRLASTLKTLVGQTDKLVERVLSGTGLTQLFARTAEVKAAMLRAGCISAWWPYYDREEALAANAPLPDPYWDIDYDGPSTTLDPSDPGYRNLFRPPLGWLDALMYLPRAYLGCATWVPAWVPEPEIAPEKVGQLMAELYQYQSTLIEKRHLIRRETRIRVQSSLHADAASAAQVADPLHRRSPDEEGHCWLVIYPAQNRKGLCPMLYWSLAEGNVFVCSLDRYSMHAASQLHLPGEQGVLTVVERIEQLLQDPRRPLAQDWARTAFDLQDNPILARERLHRQ